MLLQQLDAAPAVGLGGKTPGRRQTTCHIAWINPQQKRERNLARLPIAEFCQPVGPKTREGKMTNRGARISGHADADNRRDGIHQVRERLNCDRAVGRSFLDSFVQCVPLVFRNNCEGKDCWAASGLVGQ